MAIALRGTLNHLAGSINNGGNVTLTFDVTTPPLENDYVVVFGGHGIGTTTLADPSGYTLIAKHETTSPIFGMWYKKMTATPDLTVVGDGGGTNTDGVAYGCWVLSGVDQTTPLDVTATTAGPTTSTNPDAPSITPVTENAWVIPCALSEVSDNSPGTVSGYSNQLDIRRVETNPVTIAGATFDSGVVDAEDPAAWDSWSSGLWYAITAAFRPDVPAPPPPFPYHAVNEQRKAMQIMMTR